MARANAPAPVPESPVNCNAIFALASYPEPVASLVQAVHSLLLQVQFLSPQASERDVTNILQSVAQMMCRSTIGFQRDYGDVSPLVRCAPPNHEKNSQPLALLQVYELFHIGMEELCHCHGYKTSKPHSFCDEVFPVRSL